METLHLNRSSVFKTSATYAIMGTVGYIVIFFVFKLLGLLEHTELRVLNFILLFFLCGRAIRTYQLETNYEMNYFEGLSIGFLVSAISFILFGGFVMAYLHFDNQFMSYLKTNSPAGFYPSPLNSAFAMASEGIAAGIVMGLILMQYFKQNRYNSA